jgi:YbbR domain-containing protein
MIAILRHIFLHDFWLKLFSVVLAMALWAIVFVDTQSKELAPVPQVQSPVERPLYNLPVIVMSAAEDVHAYKVIPDVVTVTVQGEKEAIQKLQPKDIRVLLDLTGIQSARDLTKNVEVTTPPGFSVVRVAPKDVRVILPSRAN